MDTPLPKTTQNLLFLGTLVALVWSTVLLFAGGFTTSIGAGMAFLDWPLSNGSLNPEGWLEKPDQLAEHSHRLAGMVIGLLAIGLAVLFQTFEPRRPVRRLAWALLALVILQGLLGGLRVLLDSLNTGAPSNLVAQSFAVAHALGAQLVVLTLTTLAVVTAPRWRRSPPGASGGFRHPGVAALLILIVAVVFGAVTRHTGAGLAIPTFPAAASDGSWWPDSDRFAVWVQFLHRTLGILGVGALLAYAIGAIRTPGLAPSARTLAATAVALSALQIWLGLLILETFRNPHVTTLHMLNGAAIVATLWASLIWTRRGVETRASREPAAAHSPISTDAG